MIDFIDRKLPAYGDIVHVFECSYCKAVTVDPSGHRAWHEDAEPGEDAAGPDYDEKEEDDGAS